MFRHYSAIFRAFLHQVLKLKFDKLNIVIYTVHFIIKLLSTTYQQ
jgi:hypothetical protein